MRQHLLRQSAKNTRPEFGCTTARKPGTARGCRERIGTAAATGVRQKRYGRPRKPCSQNRAAEIAAKAIDSQKSGAEPTAKRLTTKNGRTKSLQRRSATKIRCRNRRKTIDHRKPDEQKSLQRQSATKIQCGTHCKTVDNRKPGGQSRRKTIDSRQPVCRNH